MFNGIANHAFASEKWVKVDVKELLSGDVVAIVDLTSGSAMSNDNGTTKPPVPVAVSFNEDQSELSSDVADNLQWVVTADSSGMYQFNAAGTEDYLYCTAANNGVRVGANANSTFVWKSDSNNVNSTAYYLINTATNRYLGVYNNQDWRCYTSINNNIKETVTAFFKKTVDQSEQRVQTGIILQDSLTTVKVGVQYNVPQARVISAEGAIIEGAEILWTSGNEEVLTISNGVMTPQKAGTVNVKAEYAGNDQFASSYIVLRLSVMADTYTSFSDLQADATNTNTPVTIGFNGQQVVYVYGDNAYLTDSFGNGILVYSNNHGLQPGDVLIGTTNANLVLYQGNTEITNFSTDGLSIRNAPVVPVEKTINNIADANQCTLVTLKGVTYDASSNTFIQEADTILFYDRFSVNKTLINKRKYDITGILSLYNSKMEICPRTADDIAILRIDTIGIATVTLTELEERCNADDNTPCRLVFDNLLVTWQGVNHTYVTDGNRAMMLFGESGLRTGDRISGEITGVPSLYNGTPEFGIELSDVNVYTISVNNTVPRTLVTAEELKQNPRQWMGQYVKLDHVTFVRSYTEEDYFRRLSFQSDSITFTFFNLYNRRWVIDSTAVYSLEGTVQVDGENIEIAVLAYSDLKKTGINPVVAGTLERPFTAAEAVALASSLNAGQATEQSYYIKGYVTSINEPFSETYGNTSFWINDGDSTGVGFYIFRTLYLENTLWKEGFTKINEGDEVIVYGKLTNYRGTTPETVSGQSYIYSLNGRTECEELVVLDGKLGDVNNDDEINITDVVLIIEDILQRAPQNYNATLADVNKDGLVDVTDVVNVIDAILGKIELSRGAEQIDRSAYTAFQMDLTIPAGYVLESVSLTDIAKNSHSLAYAMMPDGCCRVVACSMNNEALPGAWDEVISLNLRGKGDAQMTIDRAVFVTIDGERHELMMNPTSIAELSTFNSQLSTRYDLQGRKVEKNAKGILLENGKKVVKK